MKEDILEQMVEDWFISKPGRFIKHNVKYRPNQASVNSKDKNKYSVHSDIDLIGVDMYSENEFDKAIVVNCKSWQKGADLNKWQRIIENGILEKGKGGNYNIDVKYWKRFREFIDPEWTGAFTSKVQEETKQNCFTYIFAVTKIIKGNEQDFENNTVLTQYFNKLGFNVKVKVYDIQHFFNEMYIRMDNKEVLETPEVTHLGRTIQLLRASGLLQLLKNAK